MQLDETQWRTAKDVMLDEQIPHLAAAASSKYLFTQALESREYSITGDPR